MKKIWIFAIVGVVVLWLWSRMKANAATNSQAAQNLPKNPFAALWDNLNSQNAAATLAGANSAVTGANNLLTNLVGIFNGSGLSKGANSPITAGSGAGGPTDAQIAAASFGGASSGNYGATTA